MGMGHSTAYGYSNVYPLRHLEWQDLRVPVNAIKLSGTKPPSWVSYKGGEVLAFSDEGVEGNEEIVYFTVQLPASYAEGTDIVPHIHWLGEDDTAGNVVWKCTHSWANGNGGAVPLPAETTAVMVAPNGAADCVMDDHFDVIDGMGKEVQSVMICSLRRNSSNAADTLTGKDAYLLTADIHFQVNTPGSQSEDTK